jgi:hypothetical protein
MRLAFAVILAAFSFLAVGPTVAEPSQPPAAAPAAAFGPAERAAALDRIAELIEGKYVYKDKASAIAAEVRGLKDDPELLSARDRSAWAAILTRRLGAHDIHFRVSWSPPGAPKRPLAAGGVPDPAAMDRMMAADNYGFDAVERLDGNIGYVHMSFFAHFDRELGGDKTPAARRAGEAALKLVEHADAVIFDIRQNGGGSPAMIDLLLSGFFGDKPVLLNRFYRREGDKTVDYTTLADFSGARRPDTPVFVLVSGGTVSAAEEFAYDVQTQKRGQIVGETTAGGANPGAVFDAGDGFVVFISTGAAINPITNTNWERTGVTPDIRVPAADALARAHALALEAVLSRNAASRPVEARWTLERLKAERSGLSLTPAEQAAYVGDYGDQHVAVEGGALTYRRDRGQPLRMIPLGRDAFALGGVADRRLSFERDAAGKVATLVIDDALGGSTSYRRTS